MMELSLSSQCSFDMPRSLLSFSFDSTSFIRLSCLPFFIYFLLFIFSIINIPLALYCIIYRSIQIYINTFIYLHLFNLSAIESMRPPFLLFE